MHERRIRDGLAMLRSLLIDKAFVWGLVNSVNPSSRTIGENKGPPCFTSALPTTTVTDHTLRAAMLHLRQLIPPNGLSMDDFEAYTRSVAVLFQNAPEGSGLESLLNKAGEKLSAKYVAAVRSVRAALLSAGAAPSGAAALMLSAPAGNKEGSQRLLSWELPQPTS
jgi:hypothetical protein